MATSGLDETIAEDCLGGMTGQQSMPSWSGSNVKVKLMSSAASESGDGTEISGGSYTAGGIVNSLTNFWGSPSYASGTVTIANSGSAGTVTQTGMPAVASPGIEYASLWDSAKRWWWAQLTNAVITNAGDTLTFAQSAITCSMAM